MGINTTVAKLQAFAVGASVRRRRGRTARFVAASVFPDNFLFTESINVLAMVIIGGMGSLAGVILGAAIIAALPEVFRDFQFYRLLAFGLMLMVLMIFRPQGILVPRGTKARRRAMMRQGRPPLAYAEPNPDVLW